MKSRAAPLIDAKFIAELPRVDASGKWDIKIEQGCIVCRHASGPVFVKNVSGGTRSFAGVDLDGKLRLS